MEGFIIHQNREIHLCTLFDENYAMQGLTMINSVGRYGTHNVIWHVLALSDNCYDALRKSNMNINLYGIGDILDTNLHEIVTNRKWSEFCYAAGPIFLHFLSNQLSDSHILGYVDSDCFFFNDIMLGLRPFNNDCEIQIHEHRYSLDRLMWLGKSGRFNVGLVIGILGNTYRECLARWRLQVIADSSVNEHKGTCGDQMYLNEWPLLYKSLKIIPSHGIGLAPWNLNSTKISKKDQIFFADNDPLIFYHFHGLEIFYANRWIKIWSSAPGYKFNNKDHIRIYKAYIHKLVKYRNDLEKLFSIRISPINLKKLVRLIATFQLQISFFN